MARTNRREVLSEGEIQVVHCVNRCVRRGFLCGTDELTGQNYEHRRKWIRNRLEFLAGIFGIDVLGVFGDVESPPRGPEKSTGCGQRLD